MKSVDGMNTLYPKEDEIKMKQRMKSVDGMNTLYPKDETEDEISSRNETKQKMKSVDEMR
ncbi:hypothetical protein AMTR_s00010p00239980 [Amborella trichopoda]|uniref:Uncharacterized protein n=1 Tax=Amborella trichopoda TaxID=13333 RepID=W1NGN7_AMBTC|nr:hypothetical protein AMTR_s00010p00239980 [Amborella trichopoda]